MSLSERIIDQSPNIKGFEKPTEPPYTKELGKARDKAKQIIEGSGLLKHLRLSDENDSELLTLCVTESILRNEIVNTSETIANQNNQVRYKIPIVKKIHEYYVDRENHLREALTEISRFNEEFIESNYVSIGNKVKGEAIRASFRDLVFRHTSNGMKIFPPPNLQLWPEIVMPWAKDWIAHLHT